MYNIYTPNINELSAQSQLVSQVQWLNKVGTKDARLLKLKMRIPQIKRSTRKKGCLLLLFVYFVAWSAIVYSQNINKWPFIYDLMMIFICVSHESAFFMCNESRIQRVSHGHSSLEVNHCIFFGMDIYFNGKCVLANVSTLIINVSSAPCLTGRVQWITLHKLTSEKWHNLWAQG